MNRYISKISYALVFNTLIFSAVVYAESYKDSKGYKDYQKLPCSKGGTVGQYLDKKVNVPAVEDLGWVTSPYEGGFDVERLMLLGNMKLSYRWNVNSRGVVKAANGKAIGITK